MGSRKKTHFKRTPTLKMKWTLPISGTLLSFAGAQTSNTEYKLINSDKQIRIGDKCASAVDGLGGLLSIADCDTTSTGQGGGGGGYTGGNGGHSGTQAARGACPSGGGGGSYIDNFEDNYYLFDGNVESL